MRIQKALITILSIAVVLALTVGPVGTVPARAASILVNTNADTVANDGFCTLREAITAANTNTASGAAAGECAAGSGADTITFDGDYTITLVGSQLPAVTSQITIDGNGTANTVVQASACDPTVGFGGGCGINYRVLEVTSTGNLTLNDISVKHGQPGFSTNGSGINNAGTLIVNNGYIADNFSDHANGGGIYNGVGATATLNDTVIHSNLSAENSGTGVHNDGTMTITRSVISSNVMTSGGSGGGITNTLGTLTVSDSVFTDNDADLNGGAIMNYGTATITNSAFSTNSAWISGGGIYNSSTLNVANSTFSGNEAIGATVPLGGAIYNTSGTANITNSTFSTNRAWSSGSGGGIYIASGMVTLLNNTFSGNRAYYGGGVANGGTLNFTNTIIANSITPFVDVDCDNFGTIGTNTNNLAETGNCSPSLTSDPMLGPLADNGGSTQTFALLSGSPAIDAGTNAGCPANDQRGVTRPQGAGCDIGAYELDASFPTVVSDSLVASYVTGPSSFTVTFSENVYDPSGDSDTDDVTNPDNYLIVEDGANGVFNTVSCAGGLNADDTQAAVTGVTYNSSLYTATVNFSSALPDGSYRLFVCGTTSIVDLALNELNNGVSDYTFDFIVGTVSAVTGTETETRTTTSALPATGFAPNRVTSLPPQPANSTYAALGNLWLEIPALNVKSNIVGVPQSKNKTWDVKWLGNDIGWLNGTAFPTWNGNSVLTAHVTNASGLEGPFAALKSLKYGDQVIVHMGGAKYIYEIRATKLARPYSTSFAFQSLQDHSYLTLITCQGYNPLNESYLLRRIVRAVLVEVK